MMKIHMAPGLSFPAEIITQTMAILARKGSGKSFTGRRFAEQIIKAGGQVILGDPKGDHWGIRSAADGKSPGLSVLILGGEHGDLPLEVGSGELVAKLIVEERVSTLLDLSLFRKHEVATFMTAFLEALYRLKAREQYRTPVMFIIDEGDAIAPQKPQHGEERMLGAVEDIVRRGRQRGIGCTLITQRSAVLNKNVLTQAQIMVAMRTIAPQDLKAMDAWIEVHGTPEQRATLMASLPSLPQGDAWFWSPGWPTDEGIFKRVHVDRIETFDSGATPKPGERRIVPKNLADVDLDVLRRQMAETVERAEANDPKKLRLKIGSLTALLNARPKEMVEAPPKVVVKEVSALKENHVTRLESAVAKMKEATSEIAEALRGVAETQGRMLSLESRSSPTVNIRDHKIARVQAAIDKLHPAPRAVAMETIAKDLAADAAQLPKGERKTLTAVAQYRDGLAREQLTVFTGYKKSSRDAYLQRLKERGCVETRGGRICATATGLAALGPSFEPLPAGSALLAHYRETLPEGERVVLNAAVEVYPNPIDKEKIRDVTGYKKSSTDAYLQRLRYRQLVTDHAKGSVRASDELFD